MVKLTLQIGAGRCYGKKADWLRYMALVQELLELADLEL